MVHARGNYRVAVAAVFAFGALIGTVPDRLQPMIPVLAQETTIAIRPALNAFTHGPIGFSDPNNARDSSDVTSASRSFTRYCHVNCTTQTSGETTWHSFPDGYHPIRLEVDWQAKAQMTFNGSASEGKVVARIEYSLNNGSSWSTLEEYTLTQTTGSCPQPSDQSIVCGDHVATLNLTDYQKTENIQVRAYISVQMTVCYPVCNSIRNTIGWMWVADIRVIVDNCRTPLNETTSTDRWNTSDPTLHDFKMTLTPPSGVTFNGKNVKEFDGGNGGPDTCKASYPASPYGAATSITGGNWNVDSSEQWMWDSVGWKSGPVNKDVEPLGPVLYYRSVGVAPCNTTLDQVMKIACVSPGYTTYRRNVLFLEIGTTTVTSSRDGVSISKTWP